MTHLRTSSVILGLALAASVASGCHSRKAGPENTGTSGTESSDSDTESASSQARDTHKIPSESDLATLRENFRKVHFDFDNAALTGAARSALDANAQLLMKYSQVHVRVEGHTDSYGSEDYNLALGQRRAQAVYNFLADSGVSTAKLTLISYGKEKRIVAEGTKEQEAENRRAEFVVVTGSDVAASSDEQPGVDVTVEVGG